MVAICDVRFGLVSLLREKNIGRKRETSRKLRKEVNIERRKDTKWSLNEIHKGEKEEMNIW